MFLRISGMVCLAICEKIDFQQPRFLRLLNSSTIMSDAKAIRLGD